MGFSIGIKDNLIITADWISETGSIIAEGDLMLGDTPLNDMNVSIVFELSVLQVARIRFLTEYGVALERPYISIA